MNSNAILASDVLDILFEKRNKKYGAYTLRKFYPTRVRFALLIMLGLVTIFSATTFLPKRKSMVGNPMEAIGPLLTTVLQIKEEMEKPKIHAPQTAKPTQHFTNNFTVVKDNRPATVFNNIENLAIGTFTDSTGILLTPDEPVSNEGSAIIADQPAGPDVDLPLDDPDVPPAYPGGTQALISFLERNLRSPFDISESVQVKVKFVVGNDGHLESFDIIQDGGEDFNKEVIRVLRQMPQWLPGKKNGRNVKAYCILPVKFAQVE